MEKPEFYDLQPKDYDINGEVDEALMTGDRRQGERRGSYLDNGRWFPVHYGKGDCFVVGLIFGVVIGLTAMAVMV